MRSKKFLKYSALLISIVVVLSVYEWLDNAVSLEHARQQQKTERARNSVLRQLLFASNHGMQRSEITKLLRQNLGKDHLIKEERDRVLVDDIVFRFDEAQALAEVDFLGNSD
jgi:hypothetical protein